MIHSTVPTSSTTWRRATALILLASLVWQVLWLVAAYLASGGREYSDDVAATYLRYLDDPWMLFTDRHQEVFGAAVASPLLPVEMAIWHGIFAPAGDFVALRLTMLLHMLVAIGVGFATAFRGYGTPHGRREWLLAGIIAILPVAWITSVVTVQDDSIAAAWAAACLFSFVCCGPVCAAIVAGLGMFFGKIFLGLAIVGLWIASPGSRWRIAGIGVAFGACLLAFLLWRDQGLSYAQYVYAPYMGASIYGIVSSLASDFDAYFARNVSAVATVLGLGGFVWMACRLQLSLASAVVGLHFLFLVTYFGAMPEYYAWFLPFLVVSLWTCCRQKQWCTFMFGWLATALAYGYKLLYGLNSQFPGGKVNLKQWYDERIGIDLFGPQIAVALAAVLCTFLFAYSMLISKSSRSAGVPNGETHPRAPAKQQTG